MFSALKKRWATRQDDAKLSPFPSGVAAIGQAMQTKFSKGVQYNMKIVIRGERNTGKSCLLSRLQGQPFNDAYIPTQEIQAASINWKYRSGDDVVKVDVWDIVDKGQKKKQTPQDKLKISNEPTKENTDNALALDAAFIDVYKGTHGVIMLLDITKPWTWKYIERELPRVPNHLPVLVMANFRDMGEHRLVDNDTMLAFIENLERPVGSAEINFVESSLKNSFGLRYLYQFLNMPFLILQRETLLRQLEANALEIEESREMLLRDEEKEDQNYDKFILSLGNRKIKTSGTVTPSSETDDSAPDALPCANNQSKENPISPTVPVASLPPSNVRQSAVTTTNNTINGRNYTARLETGHAANSLDKDEGTTAPSSSNDIHEFAPDTNLDPSFLEGNEKRKKWWNRKETKKVPEPVVDVISEDESDDEGGNPLVMDYQDFDSEEETQAPLGIETNATNKELSSEPESDIDNNDSVKPSDSDDSDAENPLVLADADISDDDKIETVARDRDVTGVAPVKLKPKSTLMASKDLKPDTTVVEEKVLDSVKGESNVQLSHPSSEDEDDGNIRYEVTGDFDLDEPSIDDWLGGGKRQMNSTDKEKNFRGASSSDTKEASDITSNLSEHVASITDKESLPGLSNEVNEANSNTASFMISPDDLDIFVSEQMRKTSISQESEENEKKKPRKSKEKKPGDEERKKKKKKKKASSKPEDEEQGEKKSKSKDGKKKKSSKKVTDASNESSNYELL